MGDIKCIWDVRLVEASTRDFLKKDNDMAVLYPFNAVRITVKELWICPFCRRIIKSSECSCKNFKTNFAKLQEFYGDNEHKCRLYAPNKNSAGDLFKPVSDFPFRHLGKNEISELETDFWDCIDTQVDSLYSRYYKASPVIHDGDKHFFICKDLISKAVYRFEVPKIEYKATEIFLGDYSVDTHWEKLKVFKNWTYLSSYLKSF